jgi:TatD DNase family protein
MRLLRLLRPRTPPPIPADAPWCDIKKAHASHALVKTPFATVKKEKYKPESGALVHGRCEPCQIVQVAEVVAALHGMPLEAVAHTAYATTLSMFFPAEIEHAATAAAATTT